MTVRFGVLGAGRIGQVHARAIASVEGADLVAIAEPVDAAAKAAQARFGCELRTIDQIAASDDIDAVVICTPTDTHADLIEQFARAGKAVFCEKPVDLNVDRVKQALATVEAEGATLMVGFNRRFDPDFMAVKAAIDAGRIGAVEMVTITSRDPGAPPYDYIKVSGGIFRDMTIHDFDMARYITGSEVVEVFACGANRVDPAIGAAGDIDTAVVLLTHESGAITTIDNSRKATYGYDQRVEAFGANGLASSANHHEYNTVVATGDGYRRPRLLDFFLERYAQSYLDQWAAFVTYVNGSAAAPSPASGADGRAPLVIGTAALRSMNENRPVSISEIEEEQS